jgi:pyrroloquinoline quinone (PQQ) biosynthesis protein C
MPDDPVHEIVGTALEGRRLLEHPFYRRWEEGALAPGELAEYAGQYRSFEVFLPGFLGSLESVLPAGTARELVAANLRDELGNPVPHVELFDRFAAALGADLSAKPAPATAALLDAYDSALAGGHLGALGVLVAYELQSAGIAASKATGLRTHYGLGSAATRFWDVHAELDSTHAEWTLRALEAAADDADLAEVAAGVRRGADAWWAFLDERESCRPAAGSCASA